MKYYKTSKDPNSIKSLKEVISQFIHVKDISKVNDKWNQYNKN
jgi:hypothetical protein